jgi:hypothetical protein
MNLYVKAMGKKSEGETSDKVLPIEYLGTTMVAHGQDFQHDSEFGSCMISMSYTRALLMTGAHITI